jgi:intracellular septation protein
MSAQLKMPGDVWRKLLYAWVIFFAVMGVVNLWVAFHFDTDTWVNYKLFGSMGLMLVFVLAQAVYLGKHIKPEEADTPAEET